MYDTLLDLWTEFNCLRGQVQTGEKTWEELAVEFNKLLQDKIREAQE